MSSLLTLVAVYFAPLFYTFQADWVFDKERNIEVWLQHAVTFATYTLYFFYIIFEDGSTVYYLLLFSIIGPLVDRLTGDFPGRGCLAQITTLFFFGTLAWKKESELQLVYMTLSFLLATINLIFMGMHMFKKKQDIILKSKTLF